MSAKNDADPSRPEAAGFHTTRWSMVLSARGERGGAEADLAALEQLCRQYWPPLYAFLRYRGLGPHDAEDLTQAFFANLLEKHWLRAADREKGRFRTFLLTALKRFQAKEWERARAQKRGGGQRLLSLDTEGFETAYVSGSGAEAALPAETLYDRRWALALLEAAMRRLREEYERAGKAAEYETLKPALTADRGGAPYADLAAELGIEPASARSSVHRLRRRFRDLFREEVAATVADPRDVDDEWRAMLAALVW
ncbi:MAG: sigma-70 family RNA polymerase sigma factor [Verrucomicrobiae bacterium]|nr:sigma-70 family RNA polymerase sigma factor [Verrucomicrobiae bacterium]